VRQGIAIKSAALLVPGALALASGTASAQDTAQPTQASGNWVISQTTSPIDYSPIATATTTSRKIVGSPELRLSIRCRGGHTELAFSGPAITMSGDDYFVSYRVNGGQSVQFAGSAASFGDGVAFKGDAAALLQSLPTDGDLAVQIMPLRGSAQQGSFSLNGLETLRAKIGATCKWPHILANPNNR
jgi:hypothetical protein